MYRDTKAIPTSEHLVEGVPDRYLSPSVPSDSGLFAKHLLLSSSQQMGRKNPKSKLVTVGVCRMHPLLKEAQKTQGGALGGSEDKPDSLRDKELEICVAISCLTSQNTSFQDCMRVSMGF